MRRKAKGFARLAVAVSVLIGGLVGVTGMGAVNRRLQCLQHCRRSAYNCRSCSYRRRQYTSAPVKDTHTVTGWFRWLNSPNEVHQGALVNAPWSMAACKDVLFVDAADSKKSVAAP